MLPDGRLIIWYIDDEPKDQDEIPFSVMGPIGWYITGEYLKVTYKDKAGLAFRITPLHNILSIDVVVNSPEYVEWIKAERLKAVRWEDDKAPQHVLKNPRIPMSQQVIPDLPTPARIELDTFMRRDTHVDE